MMLSMLIRIQSLKLFNYLLLFIVVIIFNVQYSAFIHFPLYLPFRIIYFILSVFSFTRTTQTPWPSAIQNIKIHFMVNIGRLQKTSRNIFRFGNSQTVPLNSVKMFVETKTNRKFEVNPSLICL